jgi:GTPase SAR1 family protein
VINLDPAVGKLPYGANVDIRDTIKYKNVMKQYNLGPNGGILTSLNLFATKFDQVMALCEKRAPTVKYILVDTPGQIEIFNWSASGSIMLESLASSFPTVIVYVVDTARSSSPTTFMSNMLYACRCASPLAFRGGPR